MKIVVDENMLGLEALASCADVIRLPGRSLRPQDLRNADALLVRSVTTVDSRLLVGSAVGFVGSATIGTDHIDLDWLQSQGITFAHAPGCNARAVAEYVLQAALRWTQQRGEPLAGKRIGLIGLGNVGTDVAKLFGALGCEVLASDPPRQRKAGAQGDGGGTATWATQSEVLNCDIVSLHVPLTRSGDDATRHLLDQKRLQCLSSSQLLLSTCRGAVIDNDALDERLRSPDAPTVVLDVWETEPSVPSALFQQVMLGTPHIAGYSVQGKLRGSQMVLAALSQWLRQTGRAESLPAEQRVEAPVVEWAGDIDSDDALLALLAGRYDQPLDHYHLEGALREEDVKAAFDQLRKQYPSRDEMSGVRVTGLVGDAYRSVLSALGVTINVKTDFTTNVTTNVTTDAKKEL